MLKTAGVLAGVAGLTQPQPAFAQLSVNIINATGIQTPLWLTGGGSKSGQQLINTSTNVYGVQPGSSYQWFLLPSDSNTSATITVPANISSLIFQVAATPTSAPPPQFGGSGAWNGYYMLGEITTGSGSSNIFDTSNVDAFSIPSRWSCTPGCTLTVGGTAFAQLPMGNPYAAVDPAQASISGSPAYKFSRQDIVSGFSTYFSQKQLSGLARSDYQNLLIPDSSPNALTRYQYLVNPTHATYINAGSLGLNPNINYGAGIQSAFETLLGKSFIISGAAGNPSPPSYYNYLATPVKSLTAAQLGMRGGSLVNSGSATNVVYGAIPYAALGAGAVINGLQFQQCTQQNSNQAGCTIAGPSPQMQNFYLANPFVLNRQIVAQNVNTANETGVIYASQPLQEYQPGLTSGYINVTAKDGSKLKPGMFVANGSMPGVIYPTVNDPADPFNGQQYSVVYVSSRAQNGELTTINLTSSPYSGTCNGSSCPIGTGYIAGSGAGATNNATTVFSWQNTPALASSGQYQVFGNAGVFALNTTDLVQYCNKPTGCSDSTIVGNVRNQIVSALNRGAVLAPGTPFIEGATTQATALPVNNVWGSPDNWFTVTDAEGNPQYNVYAAYLHNSGAMLQASAADGALSSFFASAYGFGFDENPTFNAVTPNNAQVQVPSKNEGIDAGTKITLVLTPWGSSAPSCSAGSACWSGASGNWTSTQSWVGGRVPSASSVVAFASPYASTSGGSVNVNANNVAVQALEFGYGVGSFTFNGNRIALSGTSEAYPYAISNNSTSVQTFNVPLQLNGTNPLAINAGSGSIVINQDLGGSAGWIKTGTSELQLNGVTATGTGPIRLGAGTLVLNQSDLSRAQSISASSQSLLVGSGTLPGTVGSGAMRGSISPGGHGPLYGQITFNGNLAIGDDGHVVLRTLNDNPSYSDRITVNGNLSISGVNTEIDAFPASDFQVGDAYTLIKYSGSLTGSFDSSLVPANSAIQYDATSKSIRLVHSADPNPGASCIRKGSPEDITNAVYTAFCGGQLIINSSGDYSQNWFLDVTPANRFNRVNADGNAATLSGVISGPGNITFDNTSQQSGRIILTGQNTYTGSTTVAANTWLTVNGSIASSSGLLVNSGGIISGAGFLPATTLNAGASIAPGNSIGTLTAAALNLNGGTLAIEFNGPLNDQIIVTGDVTNFTGFFAPASFPVGSSTPWPSHAYTIISAANSVAFDTGTLTVNDSGVGSALLSLGTTIVQNPDQSPTSFDVIWQPRNAVGPTTAAVNALGINSNGVGTWAALFDAGYASIAVASGNNQNNGGAAIGLTGYTTDQAAAAGLTPAFVQALQSLLLVPSGPQLSAALQTVAPQPYAAFQAVGLQTMKQQRETLLSQAGSCKSTGWVINPKNKTNPLCVFVGVENTQATYDSTASLQGFNSNVFTSLYGLEYTLSPNAEVGLAYGYGQSSAYNFSLSGAYVNSTVNSINAFVNYRIQPQWRLRGLLGYSNYALNGARAVNSVTAANAITANTTSNGFTAAVETDYTVLLTKPEAKVQAFARPLLGFAWGTYAQNGFRESSATPFATSVQAASANSFVTTVGFELGTTPIKLSKQEGASVSVAPRLTVAYQLDALANDPANKSVAASLNSAPGSAAVTTQGQNAGQNALNVGLGLDFKISESADFYVNANYQLMSNSSQYGYGGGIRVRF